MYTWMLFTAALRFLILIPFAPQLVRLRIRILKWIHWTWAVNLLEKYFQRWVWFIRTVQFGIAAFLLYLGSTHESGEGLLRDTFGV